ncbi:Hint domain-containing protein [Acidocella sp.]|uniref:Hint domain-containing protein n=1 Tax=Acidocella sp. TaxID=50710 RepID=UPI002609E7C2|nr:Hint domain-containing protein [Acidocella sp.]
MTKTIISSTIPNGVVVGEGNYALLLTITGTGKISAVTYGLYSPLSGADVINDGTISATTLGVGMIFVSTITNAGIISGGKAGVALDYGADLINSGTISGGSVYGVGLGGGSTFTNQGVVTVSGDGVVVAASGFTNQGSVHGGLAGGVLSSGSLVNSGTITGTTLGVGIINTLASAPGATLQNLAGGVISASSGIGLVIDDASTLGVTLSNAGLISGTTAAFYMTQGSLLNSGTLKGTDAGLVLISGQASNSGLISGTSYGVYLHDSGLQFFDSGTLAGGDYALKAVGSVALTLAAGAVIRGKLADQAGDGALTLTGAGGTLGGFGTDIAGFSTIDFAPGASWTLEDSAAGFGGHQQISGFGQGDALVVTDFSATSETLTRAGLVLSNASASETIGITSLPFIQDFAVNSDGVHTTIAYTPLIGIISTITSHVYVPLSLGKYSISDTLTVAAGAYAESLSANNASTLTNFGTIDGVALSGAANLVNNALIAGTLGVVIGQSGAIGYASIENNGTIEVTSPSAAAVSLSTNAAFILTNNGLISAPTFAIVSRVGATEINNGTIAGEITGPGTLDNIGVIIGGATAVGGYPELTDNSGTIIASSAGLVTMGEQVINSGLINGGSYAILNLPEIVGSRQVSYGLTLNVLSGARFVGAVKDETGNATLVLGGSVAGSLDMGTSFSGFSHLSFSNNANWTLEGGIAQLAGGETLNNFLLGDTLVLEGFSASADSFETGVGLVLSNGITQETLTIKGGFSTADFALTSGNGATTIIAEASSLVPISVVSTLIDGPIALGSAYYATNLTVTNTGCLLSQAGTPAIDGGVFTLTNAGLIDGVAGMNTLLNTGTITYIGGVDVLINHGVMGSIGAAGYVDNTGLITGARAIYAPGNYFNNTIINSGTIIGTGAIAIQLNAAGLINYGLIEGSSIAVSHYVWDAVENAGTIIGEVVDYGTLIIDPGALFEGSVTGGGIIELGGSTAGRLDMGASFSGFTTLAFDPASRWTLTAESASLAGETITGFAASDTIIFEGLDAASETYVTGAGLVLSNGTTTETLDITGSFTSADFSISTLGPATEITLIDAAPCFCPGTRITTKRGKITVEALHIGDLVKTATMGFLPIRWIGRRAYEGRFIAGNHLALPVTIARHALGFNVPSRPLVVSPGHAICEGGVLVHAWRLINGVSITQAAAVERVEYFHIELDHHVVIFAENTPVESFLDIGCRGQFQNAADAPSGLTEGQPPCLPQIEDGYYLARLKARIDARAGLTSSSVLGRLQGMLDEITTQEGMTRLRGWAQDLNAPEQPVEMEVVCGDVVVFRFLANGYRADLREAGLGSGCHGFNIALPGLPVPPSLRRAGDGAGLMGRIEQAA